jgi:hypothetical protein
VPLPANPESVPPVTTTSVAVKVDDDLDSVKVMVEVCEPPSDARLEAMATVGATVSMVIGVARPPARLSLPAASVKVAAATEIEPGAVELAVGVKMAV